MSDKLTEAIKNLDNYHNDPKWEWKRVVNSLDVYEILKAYKQAMAENERYKAALKKIIEFDAYDGERGIFVVDCDVQEIARQALDPYAKTEQEPFE